MNVEEQIEKQRSRVNGHLSKLITSSGDDTPIVRAMRYSVDAGGKRIRPLLLLAAGEALGGSEEVLLPAACAVEMIHTYSLIHDDLPAMDNDDFRRGKPSSHKVFGEAMAILAGDALLTLAFDVLSRFPDDPEYDHKKLKVITILSDAAGVRGMIQGQFLDLNSEGKVVEKEMVERIHSCKTGALIKGSVKAGATLAGATRDELEALSFYGQKIGLAFQIVDDLLDIQGSTETIGKTPGKDRTQGKVTYPSVIGLEESREKAKLLLEEAEKGIASFKEGGKVLRHLARLIVLRNK